MRYGPYTLIILLAFLVSCRDPYRPPVISTGNTYMVIEGVINTGPGPTTVRVTKSYRLDDSARLRPEMNAQVIVEKDDNTTYPLAQRGNGFYSSTLNLLPTGKYRLRVRTSGGKEYLSEYVVPKITPPIDSIGWKYEADGLRIYANAHDPTNNTRYYRWDFEETWEIRSPYKNYLKVVNGAYVPRNLPAEDVSICWTTDSSSSITITSTVQLQSDIVNEGPVHFIPKGNERLGERYSIIVSQYALDAQSFAFFEQMKRNTESIGTVFDPQPSEIRGNIKSLSDPLEPVIGYITASTIPQKRIFISKTEVPGWNFFMMCPYQAVRKHPDSIAKYIPPFMPFDDAVTDWATAYPICIDCTLRGGVVTRPSFW